MAFGTATLKLCFKRCKMSSDFIFLVFVLLLQSSEELRYAAPSSDPTVVPDSVMIEDDHETGMMGWTKFTDLRDDEKDAVLEEVDGGFVFFDVTQVRIHCEAPYPVEWRVDRMQQDDPDEFFSDVQAFTQRTGSLLSGTPENWGFTAVLQLYLVSPFVSRNYTCQGLMSNNHRQVSRTVYLSVVGLSLIAEAGKKFEINVDGKSTLDLPCRLTYVDNSIQVVLQKKEEKEDTTFAWRLMTLNNSVVYDSRVGFSLSVKDLPCIVGDYRCLVNGTEAEEEEAVHFTISNTPTNKTTADDLSPRMEETGSAAMWLDDFSPGQTQFLKELRFICCSNSKEPPKLTVAPCGNPGNCRDLNEALLKGNRGDLSMEADRGFPTPNCSHAFLYDPIFVVLCKGEGINVLQTYHYTYKNASAPDFKDHGSVGAFFGRHEIDLVSASIPTIANEGMMIKMVYFKSKTLPRAGFRGGLSVTGQDRSVRPDDFMYTGTTVTFRCYYSTYVFAVGGYWTVKWKTGDSKLFPGEEEEFRGFEYYVGSQHGTLSLTMKLERELESVSCGCSVLNTSEWKIRETKVSVRDPTAPSFKVKEEEIVWTLRSKNVTLECGLSGIPVSNKVTWMKDGKEIGLKNSKLMRIVQTELKSVLLVPEVSYEMHGEFSCETTNVAGTAVKVFHVYVEEESSRTVWAVVGVTICLVIFGGVAFVVWKYGLDNLKKIFMKKLC